MHVEWLVDVTQGSWGAVGAWGIHKTEVDIVSFLVCNKVTAPNPGFPSVSVV